MTPRSAEYFDDWYASMAGSAARAEIQQGSLGLPPELESTSLLPWTGIADVVAALAVPPGGLLVDLACGRGGYGLEVARRTGAKLTGVDFSGVAIERARELAGRHWADVDATFAVGELTASGRPGAAANAVLCVDAMQFAEPYAAGLAECWRTLVPGGCLVLTGWQPCNAGDPAVPERLRRDIAAELSTAGFVGVQSTVMAAWRDAERAMWQRAAAVGETDDPALMSLRDEGVRTLLMLERTDRMMVVGRRPDTHH